MTEPTGVTATDMTAVTGRAVRAFASLTAGRGISLVLQLVMVAMLADHLGAKALGYYTFGMAIAQLFMTFTNLGLKQVVTRDISQQPDSESWMLPNFVYLRLGLGAIVYVVLLGVVHVVDYGSDEQMAATIAGVLLVATAGQAFESSLEARLKTHILAIADLTETIVLVMVTILLIRADADFEAFLWAYVGANALYAVIVAVYGVRQTTFAWRPHPARWKTLARTAIPLGLASALSVIYFQMDVTILARLKPADDVGQYAAAYRALMAVTLLPGVMMIVVAPVLARSLALGHDVLQRRYRRVAHVLMVLMVPLAVGGSMTGWRLLPAVPGFADYGRGGIVLSILASAAALIFLGTFLQGTLIAGHGQRRLLPISAWGAGTNLALNALLIPLYSLYGAAVATVLTEAVVVFLSYRAVRHQLHLAWPVDRLAGVLLATGAMVVAVLLASPLSPFAQVAVGAVVYLGVAVAVRALRRSDLDGVLDRRELDAAPA